MAPGRGDLSRSDEYSRAAAGSQRCRPGPAFHAAGGVRPARPSHRLRRGALRPHARWPARLRADSCGRRRLFGLRGGGGPGRTARPAPRLHPDGKRADRRPGRRLMRLLFIGDIVGRAGRAVLQEHLPNLRARWKLDFVVVNGENAAGGFGITEAICDDILAAGADAVTLGNHAFDQREALVFIERQPRLIRPANYPPGTPGRGANLIEAASGAKVLVINMMGRVFMDALDDPFAGVDRELTACPLARG